MDSEGSFEVERYIGNWRVVYNGDVIATAQVRETAIQAACEALGITLQAMCDKYEPLWQILMDFCGGPDARQYVGTSKAERELKELEKQFTLAEDAFLEDFFAAVDEVDTMRRGLKRLEFP